MSLSEISLPETGDPATRADINALHAEVHETLAIARRLAATLETFRPVLDRFAAAAGSPAAGWMRRRVGPAPQLHAAECQGVMHLDPIAGCARTASHAWHATVGCHTDPGECNG